MTARHVCDCGECFGCVRASAAARCEERRRLQRGGYLERIDEAKRRQQWRRSVAMKMTRAGLVARTSR